MDMSKSDRSTDRATPELLEWVDTVDRNATQKTVLAHARAAHEAVWQGPRHQPLFQSVAGTGAARPEDFSFFFYSAPARGATVAEDDATARRLRRLQMLKLMLQEAQLAKSKKGPG
jgi:ethanolamine ammonia-lyase large subunit